MNVESHRLKGLAVGKCYSEYIPPSAASDAVRSTGTTATPTSSLNAPATPCTNPGLANSRSSHRNHTVPAASPLSNYSSSTPSRQLSSLDQAMLKSAQAMHISQINNAYMQRQKTKMDDLENVKKLAGKGPENGYIQAPLFSDSCEGDKPDGQAMLRKSQSPENLRREYTPYQNVKHLYHLEDEINK